MTRLDSLSSSSSSIFVCRMQNSTEKNHFYPSKYAKRRAEMNLEGSTIKICEIERSRVFAWHVIEFHRWKMKYLSFFRRSIIRWGRWHNSVDWNWSVVEKWRDFSSSSEVDYPHKLYFALSRAAADFPPTELGQSIEKFIILLTLSAAAADGSKKSLELLAAPNNTHTSFPIRYNLMKFISILPPFLS